MSDIDSSFRNSNPEEAYFFARNLEIIRRNKMLADADRVTLFCPECQHPLENLQMGGAEIDICEACGGGFLKRSSLEAVLTDQSELTLGQFLKRWLKSVSKPTQIYQTPCP